VAGLVKRDSVARSLCVVSPDCCRGHGKATRCSSSRWRKTVQDEKLGRACDPRLTRQTGQWERLAILVVMALCKRNIAKSAPELGPVDPTSAGGPLQRRKNRNSGLRILSSPMCWAARADTRSYPWRARPMRTTGGFSVQQTQLCLTLRGSTKSIEPTRRRTKVRRRNGSNMNLEGEVALFEGSGVELTNPGRRPCPRDFPRATSGPSCPRSHAFC
jgi:hypothetical protein